MILGTITVNRMESEVEHPAVSAIMADIVELDVAINWNTGQPEQPLPLYGLHSIWEIALAGKFVMICKLTESPSDTVICGPTSSVTAAGSVIV